MLAKGVNCLGVKFMMKRNKLVVDVIRRMGKFNVAAYDILINIIDLSEVIRCEVIKKQCFT
jgi:hypothetical protein